MAGPRGRDGLPLWESILIGAGLGLSLAAPPGPVLAKVAFDTARGRWQQGLLVGLGATSADAAFFVLVYVGLLAVLPDPRLLAVLALCGVVLMDFFAWQAWRAARQPLDPSTGRLEGWPAGFVIAFTSPFNFAWWLTAGSTYVHEHGLALAGGFFAAIMAWVAFSVLLLHFGATRVARFETYVAYSSAALLAAFGFLLAYDGLHYWQQA